MKSASFGDTTSTSSGIPLKPVYGAADVPAGWPTARTRPGEEPFLRGAYAGMYRSRPWRILQLSGYGNPEDEGERIRFLLAEGSPSFTMEHDRNTADHLYDPDHPEVAARREDVGLTGAVILGVRDYETVLEGIPIDRLYAHPGGAVVQHAPFALACYWTVARRRGIDLRLLRGTGQSDFFLTYVGCIPKQQIPARAGLRINCDIAEFCAENLPHWVPISVAGYNGAESGLNAWQELGATLACNLEHIDELVRRGRVPVDVAARMLGGVSLRTSMDIFEDAAKLRAARLLWHDLLRERYGLAGDSSLALRIHSLTSGSAMTYQQPLNNLIRGTVMAFAAVLGGTQSLGVSGYDEAISIPSRHAHQMSLRVQQILQHECNLDAVADPLGGSYYVESLTSALVDSARAFIKDIEIEGGFIVSLDSGWLLKKAAQNQAAVAERIESGQQGIVGVNLAKDDVGGFRPEVFKAPDSVWEKSMERLQILRAGRQQTRLDEALGKLYAACESAENVMPAMLDSVGADATLGDIGTTFRAAFGDWVAPVQK